MDLTWEQQALVLAIIGAFGLCGAAGHLLSSWNGAMRWQHALGRLILGVFASWIVALFAWDSLIKTKPQVLLGLAGLGGFGGGFVLNVMLKLAVRRYLPTIDKGELP